MGKDEYYPAIYGASINVKGVVAGQYDINDGYYRGFVRRANGKVKKFDAPNADLYTVALGINRHGVIVGQFTDYDYKTHGFLRTP